ncbi:MAG: CPBP family intramembrane glutamic endopeptidase [Acidimicrobiales bacterium]
MMRATAAVLATALAAALVLVQPWVGRARYRQLVAAVGERPDARLRHYRRGVAGEWTIVLLILGIAALARGHFSSVAVVGTRHQGAAAGIVVTAAVVLGISALVFYFGGTWIQETLQRQARGFLALLPRTGEERLWFVGLAVTAGCCEELIFRGFGIAYLRWLWPAAPEWALIAITAAAFGLAHLYQGPRGVVLTGLVGAYFAWVVLSTGSLWPAIAIHALLDLRVLAVRNFDAEPSGASPPAPPPPPVELPARGR